MPSRSSAVSGCRCSFGRAIRLPLSALIGSLYNIFVSKKYRGKTCAYCGQPSTGPDHVIALEFFLWKHRGNLPQVPACDACNGEKSALEHYLTALLPFGARHTFAQESLEQVPKRLRKNQRLHRELGRGQGHVWAKDDSSLVLHMMTLPVDGPKLLDLLLLVGIHGLAKVYAPPVNWYCRDKRQRALNDTPRARVNARESASALRKRHLSACATGARRA